MRIESLKAKKSPLDSHKDANYMKMKKVLDLNPNNFMVRAILISLKITVR